MQFTPYALPAIVALLGKVAMYFYARYSRVHNLQTRLYLLFLFCMSIQNLMEIRFFLRNADGVAIQPTTSGTVYFSVSILAIAFLLHLAFVIGTNWRGKDDNIPARGMAFIYLPALCLEALLWLTPFLVAGYEPMGYTYTRIPGPLFFLWEIYAPGYLLLTAGLLVSGTRKRFSAFKRAQNKLLLAGLAPIVAIVVAVVVAQRLGIRSFNATATLPIAVTVFLAVTAYATHQYRLFDIEFFLPWSSVRKRKTEFYKRIQTLIAEVAGMSSVNRIVQSLSDTLRCPVALVGGPKPALAVAGTAFGIARFPQDELRKIDRILVSNEISRVNPDVHALMRRHRVAAIVPFHPHSQAAASWLLLGEAFSEHVYSPLDFKAVETLFARLADLFLDNQLLLRNQLAEAQIEIEALQRRLANAWEQIETLQKKLGSAKNDNQCEQAVSTPGANVLPLRTELPYAADRESELLDAQVNAFEAQLIVKTLEYCKNDSSTAAELLGISPLALNDKLRQFHLRNHRTHTEP